MTALSLRPGEQLASTVCSTRVVVVKAPAGPLDIACGGAPMAPAATVAPVKPAGGDQATLLGKRYVDAEETVELLCTSAGAGELTCGGIAMTVKAAKALPASD